MKIVRLPVLFFLLALFLPAFPVRALSPVIDPDGADPFVVKTESGYLYTKTTGQDITLYQTDSLLTLGGAKETVVYRPEGALTDLWAPEIWKLDGKWVIYFAACPQGEQIHQMYVLENASGDLEEGEWTLSEMAGMDGKFAIDGTILELEEKRYFIWSGWEGDTNVRQDLYLAEMVSPTEVKEEKILLSLPEYDWETIGDPDVNEGPQILVKKDTVNLIYSASGSWTDDYCLGLLTLRVGDDPKKPENWVKHPEPVLQKEKDVYGPGHACFTVSPDGSADLLVYHAARWKGSGWTRNVRFGYAHFDEEGVFLPLHPESGEGEIEAPGGTGLVTELPLEALKEAGKNRWELTIEQADGPRSAVLIIYVRCEKLREGAQCSLGIRAREEEGRSTVDAAALVYAAENPQPLYFPVELKDGENVFDILTIVGKPKFEVCQMILV